MNKCLIVIDYTHDFVADQGALSCGEPGQRIAPALFTITQQFLEEDQYVVFAVDVHEEGDPFHPETRLFPPHNIRNTEGRKLYGEMERLYELNKQRSNVHYLDKTRYSAFNGTDLDIKLRERNIKEIHLTGVCTDICVLHTAVDAYNLGYSIVVHQDSVASFNQTGHSWAMDHFETVLGAEIK
ncbi:isochorismatase family cysteine hydrolase [Halobacillus rhizosphaerae]|uniref:cysteine hydrolase family protein n=1 Tax=Halobacillus rhizosphaerae TaxID=3064889 RepID=UPI00398AA99E